MESQVDIVRVFCWTDFQIVLQWIQQMNKKFKLLLQKRVKKIRENFDSNWFHVPTALNPADICTRKWLVKRLKECPLCWNGPIFSWLGWRCGYPRNFCCQRTRTLRKMWLIVVEEAILTLVLSETLGLEKLEISVVNRYVTRFLINLKRVFNKGKGINGALFLEELEKAKLLWVKYEQSFIKNSLNYRKLKNLLFFFNN